MLLAAEENKNLPEFAQMDENIFRGAQPTEEGYKQLKKMGIKTVINFRNEKPVIEAGRQLTTAEGMEYVSLPWTIYGKTDAKVLDEFFAIVHNPAKHPVFFHCRRGVERTGVIAYAYYVREEGMSHEAAYEKAFGAFPLKWIWKPFVNVKIEEFKPYLKKL